MRRTLKPLWVLVALVFLFEAWLWNHLVPVVAWLVALIPFRALKLQFAAAVARLPPAATLVVFVIPAALLFPLKVLGLWLLAKGSWLGAMATLALAKVVSMGVTAFIFDVTRPKLLQLAWFRWLYGHVLVWLAWAHGLIDPIKREVGEWILAALAPVRRRLASMFWLMRPKRAGRFLKRIARIRRRVRGAVPAA